MSNGRQQAVSACLFYLQPTDEFEIHGDSISYIEKKDSSSTKEHYSKHLVKKEILVSSTHRLPMIDLEMLYCSCGEKSLGIYIRSATWSYSQPLSSVAISIRDSYRSKNSDSLSSRVC